MKTETRIELYDNLRERGWELEYQHERVKMNPEADPNSLAGQQVSPHGGSTTLLIRYPSWPTAYKIRFDYGNKRFDKNIGRNATMGRAAKILGLKVEENESAFATV